MKKLDTKQTNETPKKVTLQELIARKEQNQNRKNETMEIYVESQGGTITVARPSKSLILNSKEMEENADPFLIYNSVVEPNLKDPSLHEAYGVSDPLDIIEALFIPGEIQSIAIELMAFAGFKDGLVKVVEEIKN